MLNKRIPLLPARGSHLLLLLGRSPASPRPPVPCPSGPLQDPMVPPSFPPEPPSLTQHPGPPAKGLTGCGDGGAGISVLGAAVGSLLVAVILVGCDTFVAFQCFTWVKMRRRNESGSEALSQSPQCPARVSTDTGDPQPRDRESQVRVGTRQSRAMSRHCHGMQQDAGWGLTCPQN